MPLVLAALLDVPAEPARDAARSAARAARRRRAARHDARRRRDRRRRVTSWPGRCSSFAAELPTHRQNIRTKIRQVIAFTRGGAIENVQDTIEDISDVVEESGEPAPRARESGATTSRCASPSSSRRRCSATREWLGAAVRRRRHLRAHAAARDLHAHQSRGPARSARQPLGQALARRSRRKRSPMPAIGSAVTC